MLEDGFFNPMMGVEVRRGNLPHWRQPGGLYFVTWRLADSLPQQAVRHLHQELEMWRRFNPDPTSDELESFLRRRRRQVEKWLDRGMGSCVLREVEARRIVERAILLDDNERYEIGEYAVAANHVHVTVRTLPDVDLSTVLHSWKRNSSKQIGQAPGLLDTAPHLRGRLWQKESFDHIIRDQASLDRISRYIRDHR